MEQRYKDVAVALIPPMRIFVSLTPRGLVVHVLEMMGVLSVWPETIFVFTNPTWQHLYQTDENLFLDELVKGFNHESIHQTLFRMDKPQTSSDFDKINGNIQNCDYTGTAHEEALRLWQERQMRRHPYRKRVVWH